MESKTNEGKSKLSSHSPMGARGGPAPPFFIHFEGSTLNIKNGKGKENIGKGPLETEKEQWKRIAGNGKGKG